MTILYRNKEISWLSFNARVLQEAQNPDVPLIERIKFMGIFSSNMDEFFRVRVATLKRLTTLGKEAKELIGHDPKKILKEVQKITLDLTAQMDSTYQNILKALENEKIFIINENCLTEEQGRFVTAYFHKNVRRNLFPVMLGQVPRFPELREKFIYLAVCLGRDEEDTCPDHALIEVPTDILPRFLILPEYRNKKFILFMDDVIRFNLNEIFETLNYKKLEAYTIKITRDAELDIEDDIAQSQIKKISRSLKQRQGGDPVRFIYDAMMPAPLLSIFSEKLGLSSEDTMIPGARYHNFKDFIQFPDFNAKQLKYDPISYLSHRDIQNHQSLFKSIEKKDILLHYPYQSFNYIIDLLREASIDPNVISIKITLYRVARNSSVVNALINAVKNGKNVVVVLELQARFDEAANIYWANRLKEEGVKVIPGVPGLKVHSKLCLISRQFKSKVQHLAMIGTGNFNEDTARLYSDHTLLTQNKALTKEVRLIFDFFENNYNISSFKHLIVSPFNMRKKFSKLIKQEIKNAEAGDKAYIWMKLNNLVDSKIIKLLCHASNAGVDVRLNVRSMFALITDSQKQTKDIQAIGIVDKFLEHSRIFIFRNGGDEKIYIGSPDLMPRNIDRRVEVLCPIYDSEIQEELKQFFLIQWSDDTKARVLDQKLGNQIKGGGKSVRAQWAIYDYLKELNIQS